MSLRNDHEVRRLRRRYQARVLPSAKSGTIIAQSPAFNTEAKSGQVITVTVSDGVQIRAPARGHR